MTHAAPFWALNSRTQSSHEQFQNMSTFKTSSQVDLVTHKTWLVNVGLTVPLWACGSFAKLGCFSILRVHHLFSECSFSEKKVIMLRSNMPLISGRDSSCPWVSDTLQNKHTKDVKSTVVKHVFCMSLQEHVPYKTFGRGQVLGGLCTVFCLCSPLVSW